MPFLFHKFLYVLPEAVVLLNNVINIISKNTM